MLLMRLQLSHDRLALLVTRAEILKLEETTFPFVMVATGRY
ncbi:hypothetical protein ACM9HO_01230 [Pseudomonas sp. KHB2.9]